MINAISKREYTGTNFDTLMLKGAVEGQEFATFKQLIKLLKCSGKDLKGLKSFATLFFIKEVENEEGEKQKVRRYFNVFSVESAKQQIVLNALDNKDYLNSVKESEFKENAYMDSFIKVA